MALTWREDPEKAPSEVRRARARTLRREQTEPQKRLWWHLRHRLPTEGTHFRRQVPLGGFIADFCNLSAKLVVEVDGDQHGLDANREHDARRTEFLRSQGFRVLRFSNRDVMTAIDMVLDTIHAALFVPTPTPTPPRKGEGK